MPCRACGDNSDYGSDSEYYTTDAVRHRGRSREMSRSDRPQPCINPCDRPCPRRPPRERCKKPCKCPKNYVKIAPITASGSVGSGTPTQVCTTDCTWYYDTCNCVLWKCIDGQWIQQNKINGCWYFYQECSKQIWKIKTSTCSGRCNMRNIGDKHCDGDVFIDCNTCTHYVYKKCKWQRKMSCTGVNVYFALAGDQRVNIVNSFSASSMVRGFVTKDAQGQDVVGKNAYFDVKTRKLYTYDEDSDGWIYRNLKPGETHVVDKWGTFYKIGSANAMTTNGFATSLDPRSQGRRGGGMGGSMGGGCCNTTCDEGLKDGDLLINGFDCSFYTWDACHEEWVLRTTFDCTTDDLENPLFQSLTEIDDAVSITKMGQSFYPTAARGTLNLTPDASGNFVIPATGVYDMRFRYCIDIEGTITNNYIFNVKIILNDDTDPANALSSTTTYLHLDGELTSNQACDWNQTVARLDAGDTISLYYDVYSATTPTTFTIAVKNVVLVEMVAGRRPT